MFTGQHGGERSQTPSSQGTGGGFTIYSMIVCSQVLAGAGDTAGTKSQVLVHPLLAHKVGSISIIPILQLKKLRHREVP